MPITVKFFASLRERLGRAEAELRAEQADTAAAVWRVVAADAPLPANILIAINHDYAKPADRVRDGDEVAFFPPVTGG